MRNLNQSSTYELIDESNTTSFSIGDAGEPLASGDSPALLFPTINEARESFLRDTLGELGTLYVKGMYEWIENNKPDLNLQLIKLEERIESCNLSLFDDEEFKALLQTYVLWHKAAIALYKNHLHKKGGDTDMGFTIEAEEPIEPGTYNATISSIESKDGKFGPRLHVMFEIEDGRTVTGFFPAKATRNNKTGKLFERALGGLRKLENSDELVGASVKVLIEENHQNGSVYSNVTKVL